MALGGGIWLFQNKKLPGAYINFVSKERASVTIADRGYGTMALELDWGPSGIFRVDADTFQTSCQSIFGYDYGNDKIKALRDLFINLKTGYFYRLNADGETAKNALAKAKYAGIRGNDLSVAVQDDPDHTGAFVVTTYLKTDGVVKAVDKQDNVKTGEALRANDYVTFIKTGALTVTASASLTGGTNGTAITTANYQKYIELIEPYYFNCMGYAGADSTIQSLLINFVKRCRENSGAKFQLILHGKEKVNYEGVISVKNNVTDSGAEIGNLVYWLTGKEASCQINQSCTNAIYDGEYTVNTAYKQYELEQAITDGMLMLHNVADSVSGNIQGDTRILEDINTFTEFTKAKNEDFSFNQVIRVLDNAAIDIGRLFNKQYLGKVQNDASGRLSLWNDGVALFENYQKVRAIQNFADSDLPIPTQGESKNSVLWTFEIQPTVCMEKLYCTIYVA
nr:MAG TPA: tail sheath protein [Caudoviricetes sp.]